jgi:hypothetical protein
VRTKYASHLRPSCGWVPGTHLMGDPALHLDLMSSLGEKEFFTILCSHRA